MRQFKRIEWNLQKIGAHGLSAEEVEAAFDRAFHLQQRKDGSFQMFAEVPSGRKVWVIWRSDREDDEIPDAFGDPAESRLASFRPWSKSQSTRVAPSCRRNRAREGRFSGRNASVTGGERHKKVGRALCAR